MKKKFIVNPKQIKNQQNFEAYSKVPEFCFYNFWKLLTTYSILTPSKYVPFH